MRDNKMNNKRDTSYSQVAGQTWKNRQAIANTKATKINSSVINEPIGSEAIPNIVKISQADYDAAVIAGSIIETTFYLIPTE